MRREMVRQCELKCIGEEDGKKRSGGRGREASLQSACDDFGGNPLFDSRRIRPTLVQSGGMIFPMFSQVSVLDVSGRPVDWAEKVEERPGGFVQPS